MEPVERPTGYLVEDEETAKALLAVEAELLESEGINPDWPGFPKERPDKDRREGHP
ncbi:MAG: hypothetical protein LC808_41215 [Actinobacteria bacterium]|nr:hypothetical protein [Actinomycetota bacterium]MCA1709360.1 hypothetical protein [Actinomycetota bacterium]